MAAGALKPGLAASFFAGGGIGWEASGCPATTRVSNRTSGGINISLGRAGDGVAESEVTASGAIGLTGGDSRVTGAGSEGAGRMGMAGKTKAASTGSQRAYRQRALRRFVVSLRTKSTATASAEARRLPSSIQ